MTKIDNIEALELLDSRGLPTVAAKITLKSGATGFALVASGASVGSQEALELRDQDKYRYNNKGVLTAVKNVNQEIAPNLIGLDACDQQHIDNLMIQIDGTANKSNLGANAILAVSLAVARAAATASKQPLYQYLATLYDNKHYIMPIPMMNIINGGCHADNNIDIQEFMIQPVKAANFTEAVRYGVEVYYKLKNILQKQKLNTAVGDEGGFAPNLSTNQEALATIVSAIEQAGFKPGEDIKLALDCAATEFYHDEKYYLKGENKSFTCDEFITYLHNLCATYPINSIEDCLDEKDHTGWQNITAKLGNSVQLVGDDLFVTNTKNLTYGIENKLANAILIKLNQIGSLSETLECIKLAQQNNFKVIISHRSGETEDSFIADLAVATGAGQIKTGAVCRSDRVAKYNRLLHIDAQLKHQAQYGI